MGWLRARRWRVLGFTALVGLTILIVEPRYLALQKAEDENAFRSLLAHGHGRFVAAAVIDVVFAVAYGLVALSFTIESRVSIAGSISVLLGSVADEVENVCLLRNIAIESTLDARAIHLMGTFRMINRLFLAVGLVVVITEYVRRHGETE